MSPFEIGIVMKWAVPSIIGTPTDVTQTAAWQALRKRAAELYPRLEASIRACKYGGQEHSMSTSLFATARKLVLAFFDLRAGLMLPLMSLPPCPNSAGIQAIAGGYIDQANMLPECLDTADDMIDDGILVSQGTDPVVVENAARVAMTRPFLLALLNGMDRPQSTDAMVKEYKDFVPSPAVLQATTLAALLAASPFAVNLPFALPAPGSQAPPPAPVSTPPPPYKPPPPQTYAPVATSVRGTPSGAHGPLFDDPSRTGFRRDSAGLSYHMGCYNGEYYPVHPLRQVRGRLGLPLPQRHHPALRCLRTSGPRSVRVPASLPGHLRHPAARLPPLRRSRSLRMARRRAHGSGSHSHG
jgi:hypothetical protein